MQTNLQLLAACYLQNNQAYSAYNILKGMCYYFTVSIIHDQLIAIDLLCCCSSMDLYSFLFSLLYEGTQMAQSRYLFAISCFQMNLLSEAEAALSPANEPSAEVFSVNLYRKIHSS